ncbi:Coiled-coil and C2 domain-containing protein 1B [Dinochytrium kinnereticum]|nr:Coiled-coil and C2 domain-containing protein 1B [Dinochytrium kinnereticum]
MSRSLVEVRSRQFRMWKKAPAQKAQRKSPSMDFGYGPEDLDDMDDLNLENDPELLAELDSLKASMGMKPSGNLGYDRKDVVVKGSSNAAVTTGDSDMDGVVAVLSSLQIGDVEEEVHVDFTDEDMNNPLLLGELSKIIGDDADSDIFVPDTRETEDTIKTEPEVSVEERTPIDANAKETLSTSDALSLEDKLRSQDSNVILKYIQLEKVRAINKKRAGDRNGALECLRAVKALESKYDQLVKDAEGGASTLVAASTPLSPPQAVTPAKSEAPSNPPLSSEHVDPISMEISESILPTISTTSSTAPTFLPKLMERLLEYKKAALTSKRQGDIARAREFLAISKRLKDAITAVEQNGVMPDGFLLPDPPSLASVAEFSSDAKNSVDDVSSSSSQGAGRKIQQAIAEAAITDILESSSLDLPKHNIPSPTASASSFNFIKNSLQSQIASCSTIAAYYLKGGKKDRALDFHKLKKAMQMDLDALEALRAAGAPTPAFHFKIVQYEIEQANSDIALDEMEFIVAQAYDLAGSSAGVASSDLECFVSFDLGWPTEEAKAGEGKGQTANAAKGHSPVFNFSKRVRIERNRTFQRYIERKRAVFDVYHQSRGWGGLSFFSKPTPLGRASVRLDTLLNKCEIHEVFPLVDIQNPRKSVGGKLELKIRLRVPLSKQDISKKEEKWLVLDLSVGATLPSVPTSQPISEQPKAISASAKPVQKEAVATDESDIPKTESKVLDKPPLAKNAEASSRLTTKEPAVPIIPTGQLTPSAGKAISPPATGTKEAVGTEPSPLGEDVGELEQQFLNPDNIASNQVLESEYTALSAQIASLQAARKAVPEDLNDRKMGLELRMNLLVTLVQVGKLTMPDYIASVKASIATSKKQAISFKAMNKMDLAKQALKRVKLMTEEVEEVEQAMANGDL